MSEEILQRIIDRVVEVAQPERALLFGSEVRREKGRQCDADLLFIKHGTFHQGRLTGEIYLDLHGVGQAVDLILVTPEQIERYHNKRFFVVASALRERREVYHA